jgi:acetylornithine/succinyldiaminopimelate/putrescine aminotransferase
MLTRSDVAEALVPGTHASTFGGNPLAAACASAVLDELIEGGVLERSRKVGEHLGARLDALARRLGPEHVVEARGVGHLRGIELARPVAPVIDRCREGGVLVIGAGERVVRIAPPLIVTEAEVDEGVAVLEEAIAGA